jgi:hypothetical protein
LDDDFTGRRPLIDNGAGGDKPAALNGKG